MGRVQRNALVRLSSRNALCVSMLAPRRHVSMWQTISLAIGAPSKTTITGKQCLGEGFCCLQERHFLNAAGEG